MKAPVDVIRLSASEKDLLSRIKRKTCVDSWNVLCRWALTIGLSTDLNELARSQEKRDAIEIRWDTFTGRWSDVISASVLAAHHAYAGGNRHISVCEFIQMVLAKGIRILAKKTATTRDSTFAILVKSELKNQPGE